ncbi:MAG: DUF305 domain-containing protein [Thermomicrobiales bacterium]|nr:DUF305 domain-containing protein [Thermomicrobiales bacterium]
MTQITRRRFTVLAATTSLFGTRVLAQDSGHGDHKSEGDHDSFSCAVAVATPEITPYESDIPFDLAYIDTMIPHHASVVALAETAIDELADERLVEIAQAVLDTQPGEMKQLQAFRHEWYPDEPEDISEHRMHEMMMVTMAGVTSCGDADHMNLMDSEWIVQQFEDADDKDLRFIDLVIPHHQMAVHQSVVGLELAEHEELRALLQDVIDAQTAEIEMLKEIRRDIMSAY